MIAWLLAFRNTRARCYEIRTVDIIEHFWLKAWRKR